MSDRRTRTSKFLSYVLRHEPGALGLTLDPGGWADLDALVERARAEGRSLSRSLIADVIAAGEKDRFTISDDGTRIRANYGHSIDVDLALEPTPPPATLYHGTARSALAAIRADGLRPQSRQYVHLSSTPSEARAVGARHGTPVVLPIDAPALHDAGHALYRSTDAIWLARHVPPSFIAFPNA
jgi:putative RNA 2'-phosphotransferase